MRGTAIGWGRTPPAINQRGDEFDLRASQDLRVNRIQHRHPRRRGQRMFPKGVRQS